MGFAGYVAWFVISGIAFIAILLLLFVAFAYWYESVQKIISPISKRKKRLPYQEKKWVNSSEISSTEVKNFKLNVPEEVLEDLRSRLRNTRYGPPMEGVNFHFGFPAHYLKKVVSYWLNNYDWRKQEAYINSFPQYTTNIEGLTIHFVRAVPPEAAGGRVKVVPILAVHGWPGSFFELLKLVPLLNKPREISHNTFVAFEVIIPSIPGYGFSDAAEKPGLETGNTARIFNTLMNRLGHEQYFIHGGDWGSSVCSFLAAMYPERILGMNITMYNIPMPASGMKGLLAKFFPSLMKISPGDEKKLFWNNFGFTMRESGYFHINATKPDTVGSALTDSPAGLAAYILEKYSTWTNPANIDYPEGNITKYFTLDELLTNVMIYWVSNSITSSCRLYKEAFYSGPEIDLPRSIPAEMPTVLSDFQSEIGGANPPDAFAKLYFPKLITVSKHVTGGHFPSMERPDDVASDIWLLVSSVLK
ncbi:epoxide hydrolase 1-like [Paramacrobiotus metropolitanus]|uniref:epoxide hydrolase 1-like n=1 Tax=Paramacrobiotus metropolitanus TaxID=2943436 RepID=UPI00244646A2|nr:epoxide hydrolase 1-like [Paramacrobiotus metropolitanus]